MIEERTVPGMKFVIATKNPHKVLEFERILTPLGIEAVSQEALGITAEAPEDAGTFAGNSLQKAMAVHLASGLPTLADDSGLEVDALGGRPGVYSARYGGPGLTDAERYQKLLQEMEGVGERRARFVAAITLVFSAEKHYSFTGICEGKIGYGPMGEGGFGYDPIFLVGDRSFSQISGAEKDAVSHRGKALRELAEALPIYWK